ncbi:hypothetical protein Tsubulata_035956 [Turnera subulata]|uniref:Uncharacterized protein n=1 Tax=Turnera subulata TaxID=218843 RepID=A0A9Q0G6V1_9ROSI|nr:hypothetical protein Tsubulata_035956 [Turnera subulata]
MKPLMIQPSFQAARLSVREVAGVPMPPFSLICTHASKSSVQQFAGVFLHMEPAAAYLHLSMPTTVGVPLVAPTQDNPPPLLPVPTPFMTTPLTCADCFPGPFLYPNPAAASSLNPSTSTFNIPSLVQSAFFLLFCLWLLLAYTLVVSLVIQARRNKLRFLAIPRGIESSKHEAPTRTLNYTRGMALHSVISSKFMQ